MRIRTKQSGKQYVILRMLQISKMNINAKIASQIRISKVPELIIPLGFQVSFLGFPTLH
jgi:hypothetical protein